MAPQSKPPNNNPQNATRAQKPHVLPSARKPSPTQNLPPFTPPKMKLLPRFLFSQTITHTSPTEGTIKLTPNKRPLVLTLAFAATVIAGSWYGASLKAASDQKRVINEFRGASVEEKIGVLEEQRRSLVVKRNGLESKIREVSGRKDSNEGE